jgi:hypothetical protein
VNLTDITYKPRRASVRIVFDDDLAQAVESTRAAYQAQKREEAKPGQGLGSKLPQLQEAIDAAENAADEAAVEFTFQAVGRKILSDLVAACPPTSGQLERWKESVRAAPLVARSAPEFDYEKFAPLLIEAALVDPVPKRGEIGSLWEADDGWSDAIWAALWETAWKVNQEATTRPTLGTGSRPT